MTFTCSVDIQLPIDRTVALFEDPEHLDKWQDGFISMEHLSGNPGEPGSQTRFLYRIGKREIELIETIRINNLPEVFEGLYEATAMTNVMTNRFSKLGDAGTRWEAGIEYTHFNGLMPRLMVWILPGMFRKQTQKWLDQFKTFAESTPA